jgi:hypothetical protein
MPLEVVALCAGHKVLMEVNYILLIVGDPQLILDQQIGPHSICLLNIIII